MKKYLALLIPFLMLSFLVSGVSAAQGSNWAYNSPVKVVKLNKEFKIALQSNPTTGYSWNAKYDPKYIKLVNSTYVPYPTSPGIVGSGGIEIFTFKAIKPGITGITMQYQRPWESASPIKQVRYNVIILKHGPVWR